MRTGMGMDTTVWSTGRVAPVERFSFWSEVICDAVLNVEASRPAGGDFRAELTCNRLALGNFVRFRSEAHEIDRSRRLLSVKPDECYLVSLQLAGLCRVRQGEHAFTLRPGDIGVLSAARTMHLAFEHDIERAVAVVPRHTLEAACGWLAPGNAVRLARERPVTRVLAGLLAEMAAPGADLAAEEEAALGRTFVDLLASGAEGPRLSAREHGQRARLTAYLAANLADPDLTPGAAAAALGISERSVHALFAGSGTSCRAWIIEQRLARAAAALRAPEWRGSSVSEIAFRLGFAELSHFSRRFKARYGASPRAYRQTGES